MSDESVKVLHHQSNLAVVAMPGRAFPGVVLQGDSLRSMLTVLEEVACDVSTENGKLAVEDIIERVRGILSVYEEVLEKADIEIPYARDS